MKPTKTMGWNPETGEDKVFDSAEERDAAGWIDHHPSDTEKGGTVTKTDDPAKDPPLSRDELIDALQEGKVQFNPKASDKQLDHALKGALRKTLTQLEVEFDGGESTRSLLAKVRASVKRA